MSTMYTKVVLTQAGVGSFSFTPSNAPSITDYSKQLPATATINGMIFSFTWNPFSANDADRTVWVVDTAGTLTLDDVTGQKFTLPELIANKVAALTQSCAQTIVGGFQSSALGKPYNYPSKPTDQQNLSGSVLDAVMALQTAQTWTANSTYAVGAVISLNGSMMIATAVTGPTGATAPTPPAKGATVVDGGATWTIWTTPFWCEDTTTNQWAFIPHTFSEITKVGSDAKAMVATNQLKLNQLGAQAAACTTYAELQALNW